MASPAKPSKLPLPSKRYVDAAGVADRLGLTKQVARKFLAAVHARGKGAFQLNGRWRIATDDLEAIIEELKTKPYNVLLVEDDPEDVQKFVTMLEHSRLPLRLSVAVDGKAAQVCIKARPPDLLIVDLTLAGMSANDLLGAIQPLHLPTLVYSGSSNAAPIRKAMELGAVDCILKGSKGDHTLDAIDKFIRASRG